MVVGSWWCSTVIWSRAAGCSPRQTALWSMPVMLGGTGKPVMERNVGCEIDQTLQSFRALSSRHLTGMAHDERDLYHIFVVERSLGDKPMVSVEVSVIRGENDDGILGESQRIEFVQDRADVFVHEADHAVVGGDIFCQLLAVVQVRMETVHTKTGLRPG